jgi:hypothetical protein
LSFQAAFSPEIGQHGRNSKATGAMNYREKIGGTSIRLRFLAMG